MEKMLMEVVQEFLLHANRRITLDTYTQAVTPAKPQAQAEVVKRMRPDTETSAREVLA
jgi:hypothetical protein